MQAFPETGQVRNRLVRSLTRLGVPLLEQRKDNLLDEPCFTFGRQLVLAKMPGLNAVTSEPCRKTSDNQGFLVVVPGAPDYVGS
jgi:hypothetical protein